MIRYLKHLTINNILWNIYPSMYHCLTRQLMDKWYKISSPFLPYPSLSTDSWNNDDDDDDDDDSTIVQWLSLEHLDTSRWQVLHQVIVLSHRLTTSLQFRILLQCSIGPSLITECFSSWGWKLWWTFRVL